MARENVGYAVDFQRRLGLCCPALGLPEGTVFVGTSKQRPASAIQPAFGAEASFATLLDTVTRVETPEHFSFTFELAGPMRRAVAYAIDLGVRGLILMGLAWVGAIAGIFGIFDFDGVATGVMLLVAFVLEWGYFVVLELAWDGRSVGKRALGLRVVSADGRPLGVGNVFLRNLLRAADFLPSLYALGLVVMSSDPRFRRLGDVVAGTLVVYERRERIESELFIQPPPTPFELSALPQHPKLSGRDLEALELFLRRLPLYPEARLHELAEMIAPTYAERLGIRYTNPIRFLSVLYHRAAQLRSVPVPGRAASPGGFRATHA